MTDKQTEALRLAELKFTLVNHDDLAASFDVVKFDDAKAIVDRQHQHIAELEAKLAQPVELVAELEALRKENNKHKLHIATLNRTLGHILPKPEAIAQAVKS